MRFFNDTLRGRITLDRLSRGEVVEMYAATPYAFFVRRVRT